YQAKTIDFAAVRRPTASITGMSEYSVSKLANVLYTQELARRLAGSRVTTYAVHPGVIASDIWRRIPWPFRSLATMWMSSTDAGACAVLRCATAPELAADSGRYYHEGTERAASRYATPQLAQQLWDQSIAWTGLS